MQFFEDITAGRAPDALLLPNDDGAPWSKGNHARLMRAAVEKAKLPQGTTMYTLRHSHASSALLNGMNLKLLARTWARTSPYWRSTTEIRDVVATEAD